MTDRDFFAIRALVNAIREDRATKRSVIASMKRHGFSNDEILKAIAALDCRIAEGGK